MRHAAAVRAGRWHGLGLGADQQDEDAHSDAQHTDLHAIADSDCFTDTDPHGYSHHATDELADAHCDGHCGYRNAGAVPNYWAIEDSEG